MEPDTKTRLKALHTSLVFPRITERTFPEQTQEPFATASPRVHVIRLSTGPALSFSDERHSMCVFSFSLLSRENGSGHQLI